MSKKGKYPTFITKSAIKAYAKKKKLMVGSDSYEALNAAIGRLLDDAADRTKSNKRKTLKGYDF